MTILQTSRELAASPAQVFAAIQDPARLAQWWGPAGFTNTFDRFEFRRGGAWIFTMHGPNGTRHPNVSEFEDIVQDVSVRIRHLSPPQFVLTISLSRRGTCTLVNWQQAFEDAQVAAAIRHIAEPANEENLDRLAAEITQALASKP